VGGRGAASTGVDLERLYAAGGFAVDLVEDPSEAALFTAVTSGRPVVVHLCGSLRESSGGVGFSFLASEWDSRAWDLSVTALHGLLKAIDRAGARPVVVLDVNRPATITDAVSRLLLRNRFAADLFALGGAAAVLATGLPAEDPFALYRPLVAGLGRGESVGAITSAIHRASPPVGADLGEVLPHAGAALFTHLPWLRPVAGPGGRDGNR
jgi:hypothetical protein